MENVDYSQVKLSKSEWDSIEIPVNEKEQQILTNIINGYSNVNIKVNSNLSLMAYLKIEYSEKKEDFIYNKYFASNVEKLENLLKQLKPQYKPMKIDTIVRLNSSDVIRFERYNSQLINSNDYYEFILLKFIDDLLNALLKNTKKSLIKFHYCYFTLFKLSQNSISYLNRHIINFTNIIISYFSNNIDKSIIIEHCYEFIETNKYLLAYNDFQLYQHQKDIFTYCKFPNPKLILYMAPTGTGKTMTPLALSQEKKIIYVCAARHVGLALARASLSVSKKIAFAFGCETADDIRLHYSAAVEYTRNKYSGAIKKVDNSIGHKIEIIICDIKSYLPAMYYMLAFFQAEDIILYWDEPTISLDYDEHPFHEIIHKNWRENLIPNIVLSSATLPKDYEISQTINSFTSKFTDGVLFNITSHDCIKSIPIINNDGFIVLPHYLSSNYDELLQIANHCENYLTLTRYFDLRGVSEFISYLINNGYVSRKMSYERYFENLNDFTMKNIKYYYIKLLQSLNAEVWNVIYNYFNNLRRPLITENNRKHEIEKNDTSKIHKMNSVGPGINTSNNNSIHNSIQRTLSTIIPMTNTSSSNGCCGIYCTTKDAYTLTDGPTLFITSDIMKIAKFCIQQSCIPPIVLQDIMEKIEYNNIINERIQELENQLETLNTNEEKKTGSLANNKSRNKDLNKHSKFNSDDVTQNKGVSNKLKTEINNLRSLIKNACLNDNFIPNKKQHLDKWAPLDTNFNNVFTSSIDESIVNSIMSLNGVDDIFKILLMMGIGVFINHENKTYTEIMKKLADSQRLYLIIASSDYIYGTNYQFCHAYLSKDLNLTQEKIIQALGRVGRNSLQQTYTLRFRDNEHIMKLFNSCADKPEVCAMNKLFY